MSHEPLPLEEWIQIAQDIKTLQALNRKKSGIIHAYRREWPKRNGRLPKNRGWYHKHKIHL